VTVKKTNAVLRVGKFEPTFAEELALRYEIPSLPEDRERAGFLAGHASDIRVVVTSGPPGVDAEIIGALPNLEAIVNYGAGVDAIDLQAAKRRGSP
jgi:lactate dehydrogenase-like 2-hydroxyacid dehydrogenase